MKTLTGILSLLVVGAAAAQTSKQTEVRQPVALPSYKELKFAPLPALKVPEPTITTLPNGMRLYLLEDHELPLVSGTAIVRTGNLFDPSNKKGLAQITGDVLRSGGTKSKTGDQLDVQLEDIAASVESGIGEGTGTLSFSTLKENTDPVLAVFKELLTSPEFRQDKVDLEKTQIRSSIARRNDDASGIAEREYVNLIYGRNSPYGWMIEYSDIDNIQRQDLLDFHRRYYFPANIMLAVYGDFNTAEMQAKLGKLFADWTVQQPPVPKFPAVTNVAAPGVYLAAKPDVTQTFIQMGHLGGELRDKDYPALEVASQILGGGFSSRLFQRIRTKLGYAYGVGANWAANYDHPGTFTLNASTQSSHTVDTLRAMREELDKMRTSEVTDQELQTAKDTVANGFVFNFDRPSKTLNRLLIYEYYGYPKDFIFQYQKAIGAVTKADILRVAKQYFRPQDMTVVAVGNPAEFKTPLTALGTQFGKLQTLDLTIPEPKKKAEAATMDPAAKQKGQQLLEKMRAAMGGIEKLRAVKDLQYTADVTVQAGAGQMKVKQTNLFISPSTMRQDIELPFGKQSVFFGGDSGWMATPQGVQNLPPPVIKQVRGEMQRMAVNLALAESATAVGADTIEVSDSSGNTAQITLDSTGLPLKVNYDGESMAGPTAIENTYSDWRDTNGIKLPFATSVTQGGKKFADAKVTEYRINSGLSREVLGKKP